LTSSDHREKALSIESVTAGTLGQQSVAILSPYPQ
jgi:hypothetical protein